MLTPNVAITLVTADAEVALPAMTVAEPFQRGGAQRYEWSQIPRDRVMFRCARAALRRSRPTPPPRRSRPPAEQATMRADRRGGPHTEHDAVTLALAVAEAEDRRGNHTRAQHARESARALEPSYQTAIARAQAR